MKPLREPLSQEARNFLEYIRMDNLKNIAIREVKKAPIGAIDAGSLAYRFNRLTRFKCSHVADEVASEALAQLVDEKELEFVESYQARNHTYKNMYRLYGDSNARKEDHRSEYGW